MSITEDDLLRLIGKQQVMIEALQAKLKEAYASRSGTAPHGPATEEKTTPA